MQINTAKKNHTARANKKAVQIATEDTRARQSEDFRNNVK